MNTTLPIKIFFTMVLLTFCKVPIYAATCSVEEIAGTYDISDACYGTYQVEISTTSNPDSLIMTNFGGNGYQVYFDYDCNTNGIVIPDNQLIAAGFVIRNGIGSFNESNNSLSITYDAVFTMGGTQNCSLTGSLSCDKEEIAGHYYIDDLCYGEFETDIATVSNSDSLTMTNFGGNGYQIYFEYDCHSNTISIPDNQLIAAGFVIRNGTGSFNESNNSLSITYDAVFTMGGTQNCSLTGDTIAPCSDEEIADVFYITDDCYNTYEVEISTTSKEDSLIMTNFGGNGYDIHFSYDCDNNTITIPDNQMIATGFVIRNGTGSFNENDHTISICYDAVFTMGGTQNCCLTGDTIMPPLTITIDGDSVICAVEGSTTLTASGADDYTWAPATGLNTTSGAVVIANPTVTTTYTVTGTTSNNSGAATVKVLVHPRPVITVSPSDTTITSGSSATLTAGGGVTYSWNPPTGLSATTGSSVDASPTTTTSYTVTGTDVFGCTNSAVAEVTVTAPPPPCDDNEIEGTFYITDDCYNTYEVEIYTTANSDSLIMTNFAGKGNQIYFQYDCDANTITIPDGQIIESGGGMNVFVFDGAGSFNETDHEISICYEARFGVSGSQNCCLTGDTIAPVPPKNCDDNEIAKKFYISDNCFGTYEVEIRTTGNSDSLIMSNFGNLGKDVYFAYDCETNQITIDDEQLILLTTMNSYHVRDGTGSFDENTNEITLCYTKREYGPVLPYRDTPCCLTGDTVPPVPTPTCDDNEIADSFFITDSCGGTYEVEIRTTGNSDSLIMTNFGGQGHEIYFAYDCEKNTITIPGIQQISGGSIGSYVTKGSGTFDEVDHSISICYDVRFGMGGETSCCLTGDTITPRTSNCDYREIVGNYIVTDKCHGSYKVTIKETGSADSLIMTNFGGLGNDIYFEYDCENNTILIPGLQTISTASIGEYLIKGSGTFDEVNSTINICYSVLFGMGGTADCCSDLAPDPLSIDQVSLENEEVNLYPNPSTGLINVSLPLSLSGMNTTLQVFQSTGRLVRAAVINTSISTIDLSDLTEGIYFVEITQGDSRITKRIQIVK